MPKSLKKKKKDNIFVRAAEEEDEEGGMEGGRGDCFPKCAGRNVADGVRRGAPPDKLAHASPVWEDYEWRVQAIAF